MRLFRVSVLQCMLSVMLLLMGADWPALAQDFGSGLVGTVQDLTGARIPGARVHVQDPESSLQRTTKTDAHGSFRFKDLPAGTYELDITAKGFGEAKSEVTSQIGSNREIQITLHPLLFRNPSPSLEKFRRSPCSSSTPQAQCIKG